MAEKERTDIEQKLGELMHRISKQQETCVRENTKLRTLQDEANKLDQELTKLDG
jgi:hypothetical protein